VPLEKKYDYLALQTGKQLQIPFDVLIIFRRTSTPRIWSTRLCCGAFATRRGD
jgi:hypothetical protein